MRCPCCGSPVMIRGNLWECGYCGDSGAYTPEEQDVDLRFSVEIDENFWDHTDYTMPEIQEEAVAIRKLQAPEDDGFFDDHCRDILMRHYPEAFQKLSKEELCFFSLSDFLKEKLSQEQAEEAYGLLCSIVGGRNNYARYRLDLLKR